MQLKTSLRLSMSLAIFTVGCEDGPVGPDLAPGEVGIGDRRVFSTHTEIDLRYGSDGATLDGTLLLPPDPGPYPAVVMHFGSNRWTRATFGPFTRIWLDRGFAVLSYDKRGVGASTGECCPWRDRDYFQLLAKDVLAGVRAIRPLDVIDHTRVGLWGFSQGGWVAPVAAAEATADEVAFAIIGSGPAVTLEEELVYSDLTGDSDCRPSGLSEEEIDRRLAAAGPSGFDPIPFIQRMKQPSLWIYGDADTSVPVKQSLTILEDARATSQTDITIEILPDANHVWIENGGMCEDNGRTVDWVPAAFKWLRDRLHLPA